MKQPFDPSLSTARCSNHLGRCFLQRRSSRDDVRGQQLAIDAKTVELETGQSGHLLRDSCNPDHFGTRPFRSSDDGRRRASAPQPSRGTHGNHTSWQFNGRWVGPRVIADSRWGNAFFAAILGNFEAGWVESFSASLARHDISYSFLGINLLRPTREGFENDDYQARLALCFFVSLSSSNVTSSMHTAAAAFLRFEPQARNDIKKHRGFAG